MPIFEMIRYSARKYPADIPLRTEEISCTFKTAGVKKPVMPYSLHTEYSFLRSTFGSPFVRHYPIILEANKNGVPQLWYNEKWAAAFANFLIETTSGFASPKYIEIHPPFSDYTSSLEDFLGVYKVFEDIILEQYPNARILLENRSGSRYSGGKFVVSTIEQIQDLTEKLTKMQINLRITMDIPQLYTAHKVTPNTHASFLERFASLKDIREHIHGVHLWGKAKNEEGRLVAHSGDLNTFFRDKSSMKNELLSAAYSLFNDDKLRNMVLEVNSGNPDLLSIITDLRGAGFTFV